MADWDTTFKEGDDSPSPSLNSSVSGLSSLCKENIVLHRMDSEQSTEDSERELILNGGRDLRGESKTDFDTRSLTYNNTTNNTDIPEIPPRTTKHPMLNGLSTNPGTARARAAKSPYAPSTIDSIPEEQLSIPKDGNLSSFTADQMANFFRCLKVDDRIISHLHRKSVDGKRFAKLRESEMEAVGMKDNPVINYFKDRSGGKQKKGNAWLL